LKNDQIGGWAFIIGLVIAVLAGLIELGWAPTALVLLGLVVGLLNIGDKEVTGFLIAAIALLLAGTAGLGAIPAVGGFVTAMLTNLIAFVAPAVVIVAVKEIYNIAKK